MARAASCGTAVTKRPTSVTGSNGLDDELTGVNGFQANPGRKKQLLDIMH